MADEYADLNLNPSYIPPQTMTPGQVNTVSSGQLPVTLGDSAVDTGIDGGVLDIMETQADAGSLANVPAATAEGTLPQLEAVTADITPEATVQGQLENVLSEGGPLMELARSTGDEYAHSRGLLDSDLAGQSATRAMIEKATPIAAQDAQAYLSQLQTNQMYQNQAEQFNVEAGVQQVRDSILQSYQLQMENLSTANKAQLIDLEQRYSAAIQSDKNASDVYVQTMNSIGQLMSTKDLTVEQQQAGMSEMVNMLDAYLDFNFNLNSVNAVTGEVAGGGETGYSAEQFRTDQATLAEQRTAIEREAKMAEYYSRLTKLGQRPTFQRTGRTSTNKSEINAWDSAKAALDAEYAPYIR